MRDYFIIVVIVVIAAVLGLALKACSYEDEYSRRGMIRFM
jgi:hypothetical protein